MNLDSHSVRRQRKGIAGALPRSAIERRRIRLGDGAYTTLHVASFERAAFIPRIALVDPPTELVRWCRLQRARHAIVGGFYTRPGCVPLGELHIAGRAQPSVPFDAPWADVRACLEIVRGEPRIAPRHQLGAGPVLDRLQAGPLLVHGGRRVVRDDVDREGFRAGARQFDSDITCGRYPRAALTITGESLLAVACDGRSGRNVGMTLTELADALLELGATDALNLDGGGSASLVYDGRLRNRPREAHGVELLDGRPVVSAVVFEPR
jgi:hypothetical protein